eukprot:gb/GECG01004657.1/.p1 GENE.gb/GECG01004657.1/~~gb/GECG01004657.1/.p1  ORF type:complete len:417 (+),score=46.92 gb/GECG01004657.1/:1-1251(+)
MVCDDEAARGNERMDKLQGAPTLSVDAYETWIPEVNQAFQEAVQYHASSYKDQTSEMGEEPNNAGLRWKGNVESLELEFLGPLEEVYTRMLQDDPKYVVLQFASMAPLRDFDHILLPIAFYTAAVKFLIGSETKGHVSALQQALDQYKTIVMERIPCFAKTSDEYADFSEKKNDARLPVTLLANLSLASHLVRFANTLSLSAMDHVHNELSMSLIQECVLSSMAVLVRVPEMLWKGVGSLMNAVEHTYEFVTRQMLDSGGWMREIESIVFDSGSVPSRSKRNSIHANFDVLARGRAVLLLLSARWGSVRYPDPKLPLVLARKARLRMLMKSTAYVAFEEDPVSYGLLVKALLDDLSDSCGESGERTAYADTFTFPPHEIGSSFNMGLLTRPHLLSIQDPKGAERTFACSLIWVVPQ